MKRGILFLLLLAGFCQLHAQSLAQVNFSNGSTLKYMALMTDQGLLIRISDDGRILEWGTEEQSFRNNNYYSPKLTAYPGRVDYYGPESDSAFRGKPRSIGPASITYYGSYDEAFKRGKIRTVGTQIFDYYNQFDEKAIQGKVKAIGGLSVSYYNSFDINGFGGRLKSIGSSTIVYYSNFDDKAIRGKIKSIGPISYTWYTSYDQPGYGGGLKSGNFRENIAGVTYIII